MLAVVGMNCGLAGYRSFPVGQCVIFFRFMDGGIQIMHVIHGKRDIASLFET